MNVVTQALHWLRRRLGDAQRGSAILEFLGIAVLLFIPLVYFMIAAFEVQRNGYAITHAAREAGRAFVTAETEQEGVGRAQVAVRLTLEDQGLAEEAQKGVVIRFLPKEASSCKSGAALPQLGSGSLERGSEFLVCVVLSYQMPGVPTFLDAEANTAVGKFVARVEDFRR